MISFNILANPNWKRGLHPFYRWKNQLENNGIKVQIYFSHKDKRLRNSDNIFIFSRYFEQGWQNIQKRTPENESELIKYLSDLKNYAGELIWFDEAASSGSADFPIIGHVDKFVKKQVLKKMDYYKEPVNTADLRIWVNSTIKQTQVTPFIPCPANELHKIKAGWNTSVYDYRYIRNRLMPISNYLSYKIYSPRYTDINAKRNLDVAFRGTTAYKNNIEVSLQRNKIITILNDIDLKIAQGRRITKAKYFKELQSAKISLSPFGFGEICYRDFETFIAGAILVKPSLDHLTTYPNVFIPNETYIPVSWDLTDLQEKIEDISINYNQYKDIARNGQNRFKTLLNNSEYFVEAINRILDRTF
ncbi:hypothetical protein [Daejeonella oryzae]|uniref:hypothetical protein n=1 Tax=Daejeonella oryzae TaxID=1122943 RepID=UPI000413B596|nr:hypothetical protein [Daejeonella oryzae]